MRYAVIMAGGSGTRLWPMSREALPKQLIPFMDGKSLLQLAAERLAGVVPPGNLLVCTAQKHEAAVRRALPQLGADQFLGEPCGRDTLNAVGFSAAVLARRDPAAVIGVFTADHVIEPAAPFREIVAAGFALAETEPETLVTFGVTPTAAATGYGYLQLGDALGGGACLVAQFREKPDAASAREYLAAGPERYLWNSGMFVWRAETLLGCIRDYAPENHAGLARIAEAWGTPRRDAFLAELYPALKKISVDYAVMEPASRDPRRRVAAVPMPLTWLDVGSWPSFAATCAHDADGNALGGGLHLLRGTADTLVASGDPKHLIVASGCRGLIIIHTPEATLVCNAADAEAVKELQKQVAERFGAKYV